MYLYTVIDINKYNRLAVLRDPMGQYNVAHCASDLPLIESALDGPLAAVGLALLLGDDGKVFRLIFSQINCSQLRALGMLHPEPMARNSHGSPASNDTRA
jgi:hypothetical protein